MGWGTFYNKNKLVELFVGEMYQFYVTQPTKVINPEEVGGVNSELNS